MRRRHARRGGRHRGRRSSSNTRNCRRSSTCSRRSSRAACWCTTPSSATSTSRSASTARSKRPRKTAPVKVTRELRTARQVMSPIECRGFVAQWDTRLSQLILHGATQFPHVVRTGLAQVLQIPEIQIRVISSDVGGGFGYKAILAAEEICLCWLAMRCGHPVRWLEDRREQLTANANCREHHYVISAYTDEQGKFIGVRRQGGGRFRRLLGLSVHLRDRAVAGQRRSCPARMTFRSIAARPRRSSPTNARSFPIAASRGRTSATPWS